MARRRAVPGAAALSEWVLTLGKLPLNWGFRWFPETAGGPARRCASGSDSYLKDISHYLGAIE